MNRRATLGRAEVTKMRRSLDDVIARAEDDALDIEIRADLAKYACLRLCGFLEQSLLTLGRKALHGKSGGVALAFGLSHLERSFNPSKKAIADFVRRFDAAWHGDLERLLAEDERGQMIGALVGIRNQIAHGHDQGVSIDRVKDYRRVVDEVIDALLARLDP